MPSTARFYTSSAPHVVGHEALLADAAKDFIHETTRQKPWLHARYVALLETYLDENGLGAEGVLRPSLRLVTNTRTPGSRPSRQKCSRSRRTHSTILQTIW